MARPHWCSDMLSDLYSPCLCLWKNYNTVTTTSPGGGPGASFLTRKFTSPWCDNWCRSKRALAWECDYSLENNGKRVENTALSIKIEVEINSINHYPKYAVWHVWYLNSYIFLAATKQLNEWYFPSVCLSVTPFWLCSHHRIIMKFSGVITNDRSDVHAKGQGQRSKVKVTEVNTQLSRFRTVTPVWIHIWWWNDAQSLMLLRRGALLFFKVIHQISKSQGSENRRIWPKLAFPDCNSSLNSPMATKWCTKLEVA